MVLIAPPAIVSQLGWTATHACGIMQVYGYRRIYSGSRGMPDAISRTPAGSQGVPCVPLCLRLGSRRIQRDPEEFPRKGGEKSR